MRIYVWPHANYIKILTSHISTNVCVLIKIFTEQIARANILTQARIYSWRKIQLITLPLTDK